MPTSNYSAFHPCLERVSATSRTAVYGPVRTVVWEGRSREAPPYPDLWHLCDIARSRMDVRFRGKNGRAADITGTTEFDPHRSYAGSKSRSAAVSCRTEVCYPFRRKHGRHWQ